MSGARRLRVVYLDHVARLSGGEIALAGLIAALGENIEPIVILGEDGPLVGRLTALGAQVEVMPLSRSVRDLRKESLRPSGVDVRRLMPLPSYVLRLARHLRTLAPDLVHTNSLKANLYGGVAGRISGTPVVWHLRDRIDDDYLPAPAVRLVRMASKLLPSAVVANSQATLDTMPTRRTKGVVVYNPIVCRPDESRPAEPDATGPAFSVGLIGRLAPWKGQHVFLEAFEKAFRGTSTRGRIIGDALFGEDEYAAQLRTQADELGIAEQIEFRGFREDVWGELSELDILVHASVTPEPFGQVVLEGMAAGLAVIATDAGGPAELIRDEVDGLLVEPNSADALAEALERLSVDSELRQRLGEGGRARSRAFTPERTAAEMLEVYRTVAKPR